MRKTKKNKKHGVGGTPQIDVGFIISRCVKSPEHNRLYKECYVCIRKFHPDLKIVIIDDNSDKTILEEMPMENVEIIQSELHGRGEYLPYYYLLKRKLFKKAMILQDSMFLNTTVDYASVNDFIFWVELGSSTERLMFAQETISLLKMTKIPDELLTFYKNVTDEKVWVGCWGSCMIITCDFLQEIEDKIGITQWTTIIDTRGYRATLERAIGLACTYLRQNRKPYSLYGDLDDLHVSYSPGNTAYTFDMYLQDKTRIKDKIIKVWNKRGAGGKRRKRNICLSKNRTRSNRKICLKSRSKKSKQN